MIKETADDIYQVETFVKDLKNGQHVRVNSKSPQSEANITFDTGGILQLQTPRRL